MSHQSSPGSKGMRTALVLGGGGLTGTGWLIGMLAGLAEEGLNLCTADLVIGTSSGAIVGAQITSGVNLQELYERTIQLANNERALRLPPEQKSELASLIVGSASKELARARVGRAAIHAQTIATTAELRASIEVRLTSFDWPEQHLLLTVVDAETGDFATFDCESRIGFVDAIVASCSLPFVYPPAVIDGRRWIDGFIRSPANIDLAEGYERIVALAPMGQGFAPGSGVEDQAAELRRKTKAKIAVVVSDLGLDTRGDPLDPATLPEVTRAGKRQSKEVLNAISEVWL